jgi:hypothetical protein
MKTHYSEHFQGSSKNNVQMAERMYRQIDDYEKIAIREFNHYVRRLVLIRLLRKYKSSESIRMVFAAFYGVERDSSRFDRADIDANGAYSMYAIFKLGEKDKG